LVTVILQINTSEESTTKDCKMGQVAGFVCDKAVSYSGSFNVYVELSKTPHAKVILSYECVKRLQKSTGPELTDEACWQYFLDCLGKRWGEDWPMIRTEMLNSMA
jgi:hypothetical protein